MQLRPSRVLRKLRAGEVVSCLRLNLADPRVAEIAARCGFDCIWSDMEHAPNTLRDVENQIRAAKAYDVDTLVRVVRGGYTDLIRPLEMDATGIMVPHVMTAAEASEIARMTRFHPLGRRPLDGGNADGGYCMVPLDTYLQQANEQRFIIVQIEDPEPMDELEAIAAVPGIDMLFFGPGDFSQGIGAPGRFDDPRLIEARRLVAEAAARHGKFAGTTTPVEAVAACVELGYRFLSIGADVVAMTSYCQRIVAAFDEQVLKTRR
ncbi:MAG: aldolase [Phycisphaerae bacterium]|nr:aldolase [Phycisphaerae bacterium]